MLKKKRPPIVNAITVCVSHNWPDHKWVLDIEACPQEIVYHLKDKTYYSKDAIRDMSIMSTLEWNKQEINKVLHAKLFSIK